MSTQPPTSEICAICNGSGWEPTGESGKVRRCRCLESVRVERLIEEARIPQRYEHCDLDSYLPNHESQKKAKMQEWANEKRAYDLLAQLSKQLKRDIKKTFEAVGRPLLEKHGLVYPILIEIAKGEQSYLKDLKLDKKIQTALLSFLEKRIKLPKVEINAKMSLETRDPNGINIIKDVLKRASGDAKKTGAEATFIYLGAPKYKFKLVAEDYKIAEEALKQVADRLEKTMKSHQGAVQIERIK